MHHSDPHGIRAGQVVLPCADVAETQAFFCDVLGFSVAEVFPADDPRCVVLVGHGMRVELRRGAGDPGILRLLGDLAPRTLVAPNGTRIELAPAEPPVETPTLRAEWIVTPAGGPAVQGRAGMVYRDLAPGRLGGALIASSITIPEAGPVPDYVHFHRVGFQLIACVRGWVRVVYEGQGEPFVMERGDCVLQPPGIRHRVLESSAGLEVIEVTSPAEHSTLADPSKALPDLPLPPAATWGGQRFARHVGASAPWTAVGGGFEVQDTPIRAASGGRCTVRWLRAARAAEPLGSWNEVRLLVVLAGAVTLDAEDREPMGLSAGASALIPAGARHRLVGAGVELLEVAIRS